MGLPYIHAHVYTRERNFDVAVVKADNQIVKFNSSPNISYVVFLMKRETCKYTVR